MRITRVEEEAGTRFISPLSLLYHTKRVFSRVSHDLQVQQRDSLHKPRQVKNAYFD